MPDLTEYTVTINGIEHTMLLSDEDATRYGELAVKADKPATKRAPSPANKTAS
ncbi:hypothetical protein ACFVWG_23995 [Kribbella sp. NPDC058245]|uniref:hypothetical protein n=1 Tax=Kribbella sp. NPDC058245 TaxID=3346399 RepID=UPI0036E1BBEB